MSLYIFYKFNFLTAKQSPANEIKISGPVPATKLECIKAGNYHKKLMLKLHERIC